MAKKEEIIVEDVNVTEVVEETPTQETVEVIEETPEAVETPAPEAKEESTEAPIQKTEEVIEEATAAEKKTKAKKEKIEEPAPVVQEEFDWDAYEKGIDTGVDREALEKTYDETLNFVRDREVVDGTIITMNKREVVVNIGFKSDGVIPMSEFRYNPDIKIGDKVEVFIESQEDRKGQLILSHKQARATRSWDRVNAALENDEIIQGFIKCRTKGGMIVDVFGIEAFLPGSQIDVKPIRDYDVFVNKTMEFKVVKINHEFKNVVVSHKALIEA